MIDVWCPLWELPRSRSANNRTAPRSARDHRGGRRASLPLRPVDAIANGERRTKRKSSSKKTGLDTPFDPPGALLDARLGRGLDNE